LFSVQKTSTPTPEEILTWDCEIAVYKPESITMTCADGGLYVEKIKWSTWGQEGANGSGIISENLCEPSCAEGNRVTASVKITLSNLTEQNEKYYLRTLDITTSDGKDFPWGKAGSLQWDVMDFVEMMKSS
jgi:hypothetical protein